MKARYASQRHTAGFRGLRRDNYERIIIRTRGHYLGNHLDCDFPAAGPRRGAGVHFLALRDHLFCLLQGCCVFCFNFWCFYTAAAHINTGLESVIFSMAVLYNAINSFIFFGQRPPARFWTAAALGLVGIITLL